MALFEDRNKPVDIYAAGTSTRRAQDKMNSVVGGGFQRLANIADVSAGGAGVRQIGRGLQELAEPITKPFMAGRERREMRARDKEINALIGDSANPNKVQNLQNINTETLGTSSQQPLNELSAPTINEVFNAQRDTELGKMTSGAEALADGGQRNTFSIGGNTLSYDLSDQDLKRKKSIEDIDAKIAQGFEPTPKQAERIANIKQQVGFTRGGTDRTLRNLNVAPGTASQEAERRFNSRPPVNPTAEQLKQWDFNQGLKSGRTRLPADPYAGLGAKAKRELMNIKEKNKQAGINNALTNVTATERNRLLEEGNVMQNERLLNQAQLKPDTKVIKVPDGMGGTIDEIRTFDPATGQYVRAMQEPVQRLARTHKAIELLRNNIDNPLYRRKFQEKYGYLPSQAELAN